MSEQIREQVSAFLDGELPNSETELLLKRLTRDAELRESFGRYALHRRDDPAAASRAPIERADSAARVNQRHRRGRRSPRRTFRAPARVHGSRVGGKMPRGRCRCRRGRRGRGHRSPCNSGRIGPGVRPAESVTARNVAPAQPRGRPRFPYTVPAMLTADAARRVRVLYGAADDATCSPTSKCFRPAWDTSNVLSGLLADAEEQTPACSDKMRCMLTRGGFGRRPMPTTRPAPRQSPQKAS